MRDCERENLQLVLLEGTREHKVVLGCHLVGLFGTTSAEQDVTSRCLSLSCNYSTENYGL